MIIQCPNCDFSGRIPSYALGSPHNAKCPKCLFRFELRARLLEQELGMPVSEGGLDVPRAALESDPSSSAYELKAITEDFGTESEWDSPEDLWDDFASKRPTPTNERIALRVSNSTQASHPAVSSHSPANLQPTPPPGTTDPWYSRVLQVWAIVLLLWAAVILGRSLYLMFIAGSNRPEGSADLITTVVSVLLLVPGAAALFLLVDFGRYIRDLRSPARGSFVEPSKEPVQSAIRLCLRRFWHHPLVTAPVRSGT